MAPPAVAEGSSGQQGAVRGTPPVPGAPPAGSVPQQGAIEVPPTPTPMAPRDAFQFPQFGSLG